MLDLMRTPDGVKIICDGDAGVMPAAFLAEGRWNSGSGDAEARFELGDGLKVFITAKESRPQFLVLRWEHVFDAPAQVLCDAWERNYGTLSWQGLSGERFLPWYFAIKSEENIFCGGVKVRPNAFVSFECDARGITGWFDVRCGGVGVDLRGRELEVATVVSKDYGRAGSFGAVKDFCKIMCGDGIFPGKPVYGGNNWYYAYGNSSGEEIREDAKLIASLAEGLENRPFMVIDDGWQVKNCAGPWEPNEKYEDMAKVAEDMKKIGVRPGIWVRLLHDSEVEKAHPEWLLAANQYGEKHLDPSIPEVLEYAAENVRKFVGWGYELIKHDYTTFDIFGDYGHTLNGSITTRSGWSFKDKTKTSAEIILELYRTIKDAAGDAVIIGCNTVSHLCAGLVQVNRVGDDTSGKYWCRTRVLGVNSLAFRMPQNHIFYEIDADCVGILDKNIPWELNSQWLHLLAKSGTPLFVSCQNGALDEKQTEEMKKRFAEAAEQKDTAIPLDWEYNTTPETWEINGEKTRFDWEMGQFPALLRGRAQPI
ncbi:MAG: alpha-galactosidase [Clostridiales bacterium]|nr:alpha-galactosidase [Candidatus Coliplasma equi]